MNKAKTILLCGVGGQGTILAADLLARAILEAGMSVKVSEIHGMAQRGGAVSTVVRYGDFVHTMVADVGEVGFLVAFETTEALRSLSYLKREGGTLLVAQETIKPLPVACGNAHMPHDAEGKLAAAKAVLIPARNLAEKAGNPKCENVVILGALEARLNLGVGTWKHVIETRVPSKTIEANCLAFDLGLRFAQEHL